MPYGYGSANRSSSSGGSSHDRGGGQHRAAARASRAPTTAPHHPGESTGREQAIANRTYSKPATVTFQGPKVHGEGIGSQTFDKNLRTLALQDQYRQGAYQRAHPFLSKVKSGLGSLGRGLGQIGRHINPLSFAFDNPLMKLLMSGYGRRSIRNLFQRNNQNINWNDPDEEEDIAWENVNYDPNALTRLQQEGLQSLDVFPENRPLRDGMFTDDSWYLS
jgi:hypothetical protein